MRFFRGHNDKVVKQTSTTNSQKVPNLNFVNFIAICIKTQWIKSFKSETISNFSFSSHLRQHFFANLGPVVNLEYILVYPIYTHYYPIIRAE